MLRLVTIGVLAGLLAPLLAGAPAAADWRASIAGAKPMLPPRFTPMRFEIAPTPHSPVLELRGATMVPAAALPTAALPEAWSFPLVDRKLSPGEKAQPLAAELIDSIARIEPMYDPSRLDGTGAAPEMRVSAGTAAMNNVFADRWHRASRDPNVEAKTRTIAMAWQADGPRPCDAFIKHRPHSLNDPELTALTAADCRALRRDDALGPADAAPVPLAAAWIGVPVFAAPLPGSRMSSAAFWAARRARIDEIHARLQQKWQAGGMPVAAAGAR